MKVKSLSHVQLSVTPWTAAYQALHPWEFPGKSTGVGCHLISVITELGAIFPYWQKRALLPRNRSHVPRFVQLIIKELALNPVCDSRKFTHLYAAHGSTLSQGIGFRILALYLRDGIEN